MLNVLDNIGLQNSNVEKFEFSGQIQFVKKDSFRNCKQLRSISILSALDIEEETFSGCHGIQEITLPPLLSFDKNIFGTDKPSSLTSVIFTYGTEEIGTVLNNLSSLTHISFPDTLKKVNSGSFYGCNGITNLQFGRNIQIERNSFVGMNSLLSIIMPIKNNTQNQGFESLENLRQICFLNGQQGTLNLNTSIVKNSKVNYIEFENFGQDIQYLADDYFSGCSGLVELNLSNSNINTIETDMFSNCGSLERLILPNSVKSFQNQCFVDTQIRHVDLPENIEYIMNTGITLNVNRIPVSVKNIGNSTFYKSTIDNTEIVLPNYNSALKEYTFSESNISSIDINLAGGGGIISKHAFDGCENLFHVGFYGSQITKVDDYAFNNCINICQNELLDNLTEVGKYGFYGTSLTELHSETLGKIDDSAFGNSKIETVTLVDGLFSKDFSTGKPMNLGETIFDGCTRITDIYATNTTLVRLNEISDFFGVPMVIDEYDYENSIRSIYNGIKNAFGIDDSRQSFIMYLADKIVITKNGSKQDYNCLKLNSPVNDTVVTCDTSESDFPLFVKRGAILPNYIKKIQSGAFNSAKHMLSSFNFSNVDEIPQGMFKNSKTIESVYSNNDRISKIGDEAFYGCSNLKYTPNFYNVVEYGSKSFYDCGDITNINFGYKLEKIGESTFESCHKITSVKLNDRLSSIGGRAFYGCQSIEELELYDINPTRKTIFEDTFYDCICVSQVKIQKNIDIVENSFRGMNRMLSIIMDNMDNSESDEKLGVEDFNGNNIYGFQNNTKIYTKENDYKYPKYIVNGESIVKFCHNGFIVNLNAGVFEMVGFDENYNSSSQLIELDFTNVDLIKTNAFNGIDQIQKIYLPTRLFENIEGSAFSNMKNLNMVYVNTNYNERYSNMVEYITGDSNSNVSIAFNDGILTIKDGFIGDDGIFYSKDRIITGVNKSNTSSDVTIGNQYIGISSYAFIDDTTITSLNTGGIKRIYDNAFYDNTAIQNVTISYNTNRIDRKAFVNSCVKEITIPGIGGKVGNYGLSESKKLKKIKYLNGIDEISPSAMIDCLPNLTCIEFPNTITSIGEYAYAEPYDLFPRLDRVNLNELDNLSIIGPFAFYNSIHTLENNTLSLTNNYLSIMDYAFAYNRYSYTQLLNDLCFSYPIDVNIGARFIGRAAFEYNHFRRLCFGNSIDIISEYAFAYPKYKYENTLFPNSIRRIKRDAFKGNIILNPERTIKNMYYFDNCISALLRIFDTTMNEVYEADNVGGFTDTTCLSCLSTDFYTGFAYIYDNKMNFCPDGTKIDIFQKTLIQGKQDAVDVFIPKYIKSIGPAAFKDVITLKSISAEPFLNIQESAFYGCINFERFNEPDSTYYILSCADYAFYNCNKLTNIKLLSSTQKIGKYSFAGCKSITQFYDDIDGEHFRYYALNTIEDCAFQSCDNLIRFDICRNISSLGNGVFDHCHNLCDINIDLKSTEFNKRIDSTQEMSALIRFKFLNIRDDYKCLINFNDISYTNDGIVKMDNEFVETYEYDGNKLGIRKLKYDTFVNMDRSYLNLSSISKIDQFVFCDIQSLNSISFLENAENKNTIEEIGDYCFCDCRNLYNINAGRLPCFKIGQYAFQDCRALTSMCFDGNKIESIGKGAFYKSSIMELIFDDFESQQQIKEYEQRIQNVIGYSDNRKNPLALPSYCQIVFKDKEGIVIGKYSYLFNDILNIDVDINRNQQVFVDKDRKSIKPIQIVKSSQNDRFPIIMNNTFHANIVGRWK